MNELRDALLSLGFAVSPVVLELLVSKFDKTGGKNKSIEYDNFIEYVFTIPFLYFKIIKRLNVVSKCVLISNYPYILVNAGAALLLR